MNKELKNWAILKMIHQGTDRSNISVELEAAKAGLNSENPYIRYLAGNDLENALSDKGKRYNREAIAQSIKHSTHPSIKRSLEALMNAEERAYDLMFDSPAYEVGEVEQMRLLKKTDMINRLICNARA